MYKRIRTTFNLKHSMLFFGDVFVPGTLIYRKLEYYYIDSTVHLTLELSGIIQNHNESTGIVSSFVKIQKYYIPCVMLCSYRNIFQAQYLYSLPCKP